MGNSKIRSQYNQGFGHPYWRVSEYLGYSAIRLIGLVLGLAGCLLLLQQVGFLLQLKHHLGDSTAVEIETIKELTNRNIQVKGRAPPQSFVDVRINRRSNGIAYPDTNGDFYKNVSLTPAANRIEVIAYDEGMNKLGSASQRLRWGKSIFTPKLSMAYILDDTSLLWLAGTANQLQSFQILDEAGHILGQTKANELGVIDAVIDLQEKQPESISIRGENGDREQVGESIKVTRFTVEDFPLSREIEVKLPQKLNEVLGKFTGSKENHTVDERKLAEQMATKIAINIKLPAVHPYYKALTLGDLSIYDFIEHTVGSLNILPDEKLAEIQQKHFAEEFGDAQWFSPQPKVSLENNISHIEVKRHAIFMFDDDIVFERSKNGGVGAFSLLTEKDKFTVRLNGNHPNSFDSPQPSRMMDDVAVWQGPAQTTDQPYFVNLVFDKVSAMQSIV